MLYLYITWIWVEKICGMSYWTQWYHYINDQTNIIMRNVRTNQGIDLQENIGFRNRLLRCGYSNGIQSWTRARNTFYDWTTIKDAMARNKPNTAGVPNGAPRRSPNIFKTRKKLTAHYYVYWLFYRNPNKIQKFFLGSKIVKSPVKFGPKIV